MKTKLFVMILILSLIFPLITAYTPHKQNTDLKIIFDEGNATSCNITYISYPNGNINYINDLMTSYGKTFTYNISSGNFSSVGNVCIGIICYDPSATPQYEEGSICREVTISGSTALSSGEGLSLLGSLIIIILTATFFFILSVRLNNPTAKISFIIISCIVFIIAIFYSMIIVQQNLGGFENIVSGYSTFFFILKILIGISFTALMVVVILISIRFYKFKRGLID